jgi:signal transduction histidine kinase
VKIIVRDDGEGMTPAEVEIALQRGKRLDQTTEGHGIGLAVVRDIVVDAYGGLMTIASDRGGTRIEIDIPLDRD